MVLKHSDKGGEQKYRYIQYAPQLGRDGEIDVGRKNGTSRWGGQGRRDGGTKGGRVTVRVVKGRKYKDEEGKSEKK